MQKEGGLFVLVRRIKLSRENSIIWQSDSVSSIIKYLSKGRVGGLEKT